MHFIVKGLSKLINEILQVIKSFNPNGRTIEEKHYKMSQVLRHKITRIVNRQTTYNKNTVNLEIKDKLNSVLLTYS